jgi:hypothetical protein
MEADRTFVSLRISFYEFKLGRTKHKSKVASQTFYCRTSKRCVFIDIERSLLHGEMSFIEAGSTVFIFHSQSAQFPLLYFS